MGRKLFLVTRADYSEFSVLGVFSTKAKAYKAMLKDKQTVYLEWLWLRRLYGGFRGEKHSPYFYRVEEIEVDQPLTDILEEWKQWQCEPSIRRLDLVKKQVESIFKQAERPLLYSDILQRTGLDLEDVVDACDELREDGVVEWALGGFRLVSTVK